MKNPFCGWGMDIFWNHTIYVGEIGSRLFQIAASLILALKCRGNCCLFGSFKNFSHGEMGNSIFNKIVCHKMI